MSWWTDRRVRIAVDLDDTIADFSGHAKSIMRSMGIQDVDETFKKWARSKDSRLQKIYRAEGFFDNIPPIPGAIEVVKDLAEAYDVYICSSPASTSPGWSAKHKWVVEHMGEEWGKRLILMKRKVLLHVDVLIDDRPFVHDGHKETGKIQHTPWFPIMRSTGEWPEYEEWYQHFTDWKDARKIIDRYAISNW